jgi:hypothetical protein
VYLFAGLDAGDEEAMRALFADYEMEIVHLDVEEELTLVGWFSTLYGAVVACFASLALLAALLVVCGQVALCLQRLMVAARCCATPGDLRRLLLQRLLPQAALGLLSGGDGDRARRGPARFLPRGMLAHYFGWMVRAR